MPLNLIDICTVKFPGQIESENITFRKPMDEDFQFVIWNVEGVPKPTEASIMAEAPQWERPYAIFQAFNTFLPYIDRLLDKAAQLKQYGSAVSISTYANSTHTPWKAEAEAFIAWRDAIFLYAINMQDEVQKGAPIPSMDEFIAKLPTIIWP